MGWYLARNTDFSGFQLEIAFLLSIFFILAVWVFYDSDKYFNGKIMHIFWLLTLFTGPIGLITYLIMRKKLDEH